MLNQKGSKVSLTPIMERTLESVLSPSYHKSSRDMDSTVKRLGDDRPLTGTGKYLLGNN